MLSKPHRYLTMKNKNKPDINWLQIVASEKAATNLPPGSTFITWAELIPTDVENFAKSSDAIWHLPELTEVERDALLLDYNDMIANIGVESGRDSVWWYTWTSSRDRFLSSILADMELMARFQKACDQGLPKHSVMLCRDPYLSRVLVDIARLNGVRTRLAIADRLRWTQHRIKMKASPLIGSIRTCGRMLLIKSHIKQNIAHIEQAQQKPERTLLVTWISSDNLLNSQPPNDTYFGPLPKFLGSNEHSVTVFGDIHLGLPEKQGRGRFTPSGPVLTAASFISYLAILGAFIRGFLSQVPVLETLKSEKPYLVPLVQRDVHSNRGSMVYGLLMESAIRRLLEILRPTQIIHMCENNPWERACSRAAESLNSESTITGYMHCSVILSHTKIVITEKEKSIRPRPSKLICTGSKARDIMVQFGGHSPNEVVGACSLRHTYMTDIQPRDKITQPVRNVLVILEGLSSVSHLVRFVYDSLDGDDRFRVVIRPHPAVGAERILKDAGISTSDFKTLTLSEHRHITQDLGEADLVVYKCSTAAVEAGYMGIPLIHYQHPNILTDDPLFEITSLKQVVSTHEELVRAIQDYGSMDQAQFIRQSKMLRQYIDDYLTAPSPENVTHFLRGSPKAASFD